MIIYILSIINAGSIRIKKVVKLLETDEYAANLWNQPQSSLTMNDGQKNAIKSSANVRFRLIQGPPGI